MHAADLAEALDRRRHERRGACGAPTMPATPRSSPAPTWRVRSGGHGPVAGGHPGAGRRSAGASCGVTEAAARLAGQTTILTADKANEFFQPAWTGDPGPLTRGHRVACRTGPARRTGGDLPMVSGGRMAVAVRPRRGRARATDRPRLRRVDLVLLGYLAVVTAVAVSRAPGQPECWWLAAGQRARRGAHRPAHPARARAGSARVREIYPLLLLLGALRRAGRAEPGRRPRCTMRWSSIGSWRCSACR